jgi:hypothetical protein
LEIVFGKEKPMPIIDNKSWDKWVEKNDDPCGKCCVDVAREVMRILDDEPGDFDCHKIITQADNNIHAHGITGFMAGCVAQMVSKAHSRGEEFRRKWNLDNQCGNEGEKANESGGVLNPALMTIKVAD